MYNYLNKLSYPVLFVGIGNPLKGDDSAGIELVSRIKVDNKKIYSIICYEVPENYIDKIIIYNANSIIFVDAVDMGQAPGTIKHFLSDDIIKTGIFTHGLSLSMLIEYLKMRTNAGISVLGIQPNNLKIGGKLSKEVNDSIGGFIACMN